MSSTSLSPAPSEASTSRVPRSPLKPVKFLHPNTYIAPKSVKRRRAPSSEPYPPAQPKRIRDGTPICQEAEDSTSGDRPAGGQNASVPAYTTTAAGPSSYAAQEDDPGLVAVTSDGGEGSVLFSENAAIGTKGKTTIMDGDIGHRQANGSGRRDDAPAGDDFLPEEGVDGHGDGQDLGEEPREDGSEGEDEACEEDGGAHEESQDQNDVNEEDEDGAEPPAWLKEPQIISSRALPDSWSSLPLDRMSRVLEAKMEPEPKPRPALSHHIASWAKVPNAEDKEVLSDDPPASPSSYHSGDSDDFVMAHRPILERTEIKRDIKAFVSSLGTYGSDMFEPLTGLCRYPVIDRLGEGSWTSGPHETY